jgi:DNA-binding winged helix-turn-helix (wHTH) protein
VPRYRFDDFILSPRQRALLRHGSEQPLIPRYFDLLVFLVEHRYEAVHRRQIFEQVWSDVVVSDSALSQAIRTIRRALGDDSREPRFVRTVSRHGYRFVFPEVVEEDDGGESEPILQMPVSGVKQTMPGSRADAEQHAHGESISHGRADRSLATWQQVIRRARRQSAAASSGGAAAGALGGIAGALLLVLAPGSLAPWPIVPVLAVVGAGCGGLGAAGVGAGLAGAESTGSPPNALALVVGGACGGGSVGLLVQLFARWTLSVLVGVNVAVAGGLEGLAIGAAAGGGVALATIIAQRRPAAGARRFTAACCVALTCGAAALVLALAGRTLVGGTIHAIAQSSRSQAALTPLARLVGEPDFGPLTAALISIGEGAVFGFGLMLGLTSPRKP